MTFLVTMRASVNAVDAVALSRLTPETSSRMFNAIQRPRYNVGAVTTPQQVRMFYRDVGMGAQSIMLDNHAIKNQLSTDTHSTVRKIFKFDGEGYDAAREAYRKGFNKVYGRYPSAQSEVLDKHPWDLLKFADRKQIEKSDVPYVNYYRQATNTSIERGGKMHFFLGKFSVKEYVESIVLAETREKKSFAQIASTISWPTLVQLGKREISDPYVGIVQEATEDFVKQPTITTVELYDSTVGEFSEKGKDFKYYAENDELLDTGKLLELQQAALDEARKPENAERLQTGKSMTKEAQAALEKFQNYINRGAD